MAVLQETDEETGEEEVALAETLLTYSERVLSESGGAFIARACGAAAGHTWQGWIEFISIADGSTERSGRETTQPNRSDLLYWATGLTPVYLQGALRRALEPVGRRLVPPPSTPAYDGPAPDFSLPVNVTESVLNPLSVYRKGETLLRRQLGAFSAWHLVNIVRHYSLSEQSTDTLNSLASPALVELIVSATRERVETSIR